MNAPPASRTAPGGVCHLLREDPELADAIPEDRREQAIEDCQVPVLTLAVSGWEPHERVSAGETIALIVLEGQLIRRVGVEGRFGAELLGESDVLRPWQLESLSSTLALTTVWAVVAPARVAVSSSDFLLQLGRYPELSVCLLARALQRARHLAVNMAIVQQARVDVRLHMLLWHLAGRWGRVRSDGTLLPMHLTHAQLADLVAARRPTVSSALSDLARRGLIVPTGEHWLLVGEPPKELLDISLEDG